MLILGVVTIACGFIFFFFLVDNPRSRLLRLTPEQLAAVEERIKDNAVVITKEIKYHQIIEAIKEPRLYCFAFASMLINFQNGALNTFSSIITQGFGFAVSLKLISHSICIKLLSQWPSFLQGVDAILLTVPSGVVTVIYILAAIWYNRRYGNTLYVAMVLLGFSILGLVLLLAIPLAKAKLLGLYLCWSFVAAYTMLLVSLVCPYLVIVMLLSRSSFANLHFVLSFLSKKSNNVSGYTKKIFYSSVLIVLYTVRR